LEFPASTIIAWFPAIYANPAATINVLEPVPIVLLVDDVVLNILPDVPDDPDVPFVPDVPDVPEEPEEPLDPEVPDVPDDPEVPELPEDPDDPEVPDVPDVPTLAVNPTSPLPVLYDNINSEFETLLILLLSIVTLPVTPNEPDIKISLSSFEESAFIILVTCSDRIILPLIIPEVLIVAIKNYLLELFSNKY
jgi:hypothetical protein